jgi:hypothetical protein
MTGHPLDRSAAFTALLEFCPWFGRLGMGESAGMITRFLADFRASGGTDMAAFARRWALGNGPCETEAQARAAARHIYDAVHASNRRGAMAEANHRLLCEALSAAGVELGAYDHRIVSWLAGWEPETVAVMANSEHAARLALAASIAAGNPVSQRSIMTRFGLTRTAERRVRQEVIASTNGHGPPGSVPAV